MGPPRSKSDDGQGDTGKKIVPQAAEKRRRMFHEQKPDPGEMEIFPGERAFRTKREGPSGGILTGMTFATGE